MPGNESFQSANYESLKYDLLWIRDQATDEPQWLLDQADRVYATIEAGLKAEAVYFQTVETILYLLACALKDDAWQPWFEQINTLAQKSPAGSLNEFQAGFRAVVADFQPVIGIYGRLNSARPVAVETLLSAYTRLFKVLVLNHGMLIQYDLLDQAIATAQRLDDHLESGKLHQTLALYFAHYGDIQTAENYGKLAFNDYEYIEDAPGIADAACTLAIIFYDSLRFAQGQYYLDRALSKVDGQTPDKRFATLFYEKGVYCFYHNDYNLALSYYQRALAIYQEFDAVHQVAMTQQALAQVYTYAHDFASAEAMIRAARQAWEKLRNNFELVNNHIIEGELECERKNLGLGLRILEEALDMAHSMLEDTPARETMITLLEDYIKDRYPDSYRR